MKNMIRIFNRGFDVMRDHDDGDAFLVELRNKFIHLRSNFGIKSGYGLIEDQHFLSST